MAGRCGNLTQTILFALAILSLVASLTFIILFICNFATGDTVFEIPMYISLGVSIASALTYGLTYVGVNAHILFKNSNGEENEEDDQYRPHAGPSGNSELPRSSADSTHERPTN
ncbi:unnamed protein product [Hymenolepis diminuta]|uniref:Uncharacterized protein n=1 Tax=Hymenolepis diminuta TaxID=6216 RepID=A0A564Z8D9_HYMDI|nr:unnamed protein product [Hymenolepis diminuta]